MLPYSTSLPKIPNVLNKHNYLKSCSVKYNVPGLCSDQFETQFFTIFYLQNKSLFCWFSRLHW